MYWSYGEPVFHTYAMFSQSALTYLEQHDPSFWSQALVNSLWCYVEALHWALESRRFWIPAVLVTREDLLMWCVCMFSNR